MLEQRGKPESESEGGFKVSGFQPWREQKFKNLYNRKHLKSQKAEHGSADGRGGNLALPLKAELFGRVNGQQLISFVLCFVNGNWVRLTWWSLDRGIAT